MILHCLADTGKESMTRLEFKQRLSIAIGAAKGDKTFQFSCAVFPHQTKVYNTVSETTKIFRSESSAQPRASFDPQGLQDEQCFGR